MFARSYTAGLCGVEGFVITVEADARLGLPGLVVVGLAQGAVGEARERVRNAIAHCGHTIRPRRQVVNLAPADRRKDSPGIDLALACALLGSHEIIPAKPLESVMAWGELGLNGEVRPTNGTLVVADCAAQSGFSTLAVPAASAPEAAMLPGLKVLPVTSLPQLVAHLRGDRTIEPFMGPPRWCTPVDELDMADVNGQTLAKLGLEVMVAGGHNLLMHGPPGVGKTMLARRAIQLFPDLTEQQALDVTKIHSVARHRSPSGLTRRPPFRTPHHTVTVAGLVGGGTPVRPGEVSLAHHGLLFLDELLEFRRHCLEGLREPLEDGEVTIVRATGAVRLPARFQLMAAMNPCPCGYLGHPHRACSDTIAAVQRYQQRMSGPLLDRMDLLIPMAPPKQRPSNPGSSGPHETTSDLRARIVRAQTRQWQRFQAQPWSKNAQIPGITAHLDRFCQLTASAEQLLTRLARQRDLSPRVQHRIRRVARTIADLQRDDATVDQPIEHRELATASQLRRGPQTL